MKKMKRAIYLFGILFILCGCTQKVHVKTISENREITKEQKTKNKKDHKKTKAHNLHILYKAESPAHL